MIENCHMVTIIKDHLSCLPVVNKAVVIVHKTGFVEKAVLEYNRLNDVYYFNTWRIDKHRDPISVDIEEVAYWCYIPRKTLEVK